MRGVKYQEFYLMFSGKLSPLFYLIPANSKNPAADRKKEVLFFQQLVEAVRYLHDIVGKPHGNLNAYDTIFYDENSNLKLLNFDMEDLGCIDKRRYVKLNSPPREYNDEYKSPEELELESLEELDRSSRSGVANDIWRLGIIFFQLLTGRTPFEGPKSELAAWSKKLRQSKMPREEIEKLFEEELGCKFQVAYSGRNFTEQEEAFGKKMLVLDPAKRKDAIQLLKDPVFGSQREQVVKLILRMRYEGKGKMQKAMVVDAIAKSVLRFFPPVPVVHAEKSEQLSIS